MFFTVANHNEAKNAKGFIHYDDVEFRLGDIEKLPIDDNSIDGAKWSTSINASCTLAETGQKIVITPANSTVDSYGYLNAGTTYNLTGKSVSVNVPV